jgi:hypothetical protein
MLSNLDIQSFLSPASSAISAPLRENYPIKSIVRSPSARLVARPEVVAFLAVFELK